MLLEPQMTSVSVTKCVDCQRAFSLNVLQQKALSAFLRCILIDENPLEYVCSSHFLTPVAPWGLQMKENTVKCKCRAKKLFSATDNTGELQVCHCESKPRQGACHNDPVESFYPFAEQMILQIPNLDIQPLELKNMIDSLDSHTIFYDQPLKVNAKQETLPSLCSTYLPQRKESIRKFITIVKGSSRKRLFLKKAITASLLQLGRISASST